jgi:uncharacterized protein (PEP-CTERM system associated)
MPTAARTWRAVAAVLLLTAASVARGQYGTPSAPRTTQTPGTTQATPGAQGTQARDPATAADSRFRAGGWSVQPSIDVRETYTDNAFPDSTEAKSDFVTQVTPGIRIEGRTPRLTANFNYAPTVLFFARNNDANDVVNNLSAYANLEAVERFFFIEGSGYIAQSYVSPFAPRPTDIVNSTQNRLETRTATLSPYVRHEGRDLEYELRNRNTWTSSDQSGLGNFRTLQWTGRVAGPVRRFGWALEFDDITITHYDALVNRPDDKGRLYRGRLYWQPDPAWRLSASAGSEENNYVLQEVQRTTIYGAALAWRPSARTTADLEYENRFFGPYRLARFTHRTRLTAWSLSYSRNYSTFQQEALRLPAGDTTALLDAAFAGRIPDPDQRRAAVEQFQRASGTPAFLANSIAFYTQQVFLYEVVDASFAIIGARNSITFTAYVGESSQISADALGVLPDALLLATVIRQRGFAAYVDHKLTPTTSIGGFASRVYSDQVQPAGFPSKNAYFRLLLNYSASPKTTLYTGVAVNRYDTDIPNFNPNWDSTSVFAGLNHRFY